MVKTDNKRYSLVAYTADWHVNDMLALCPPKFHREREATHRPGKAVRSLWVAWTEFWEIVKRKKEELEAAGKDVDVYAVCNGDLGDINKHSKAQLISTLKNDVVRAMVDVAQPMIGVVEKNIFVIRGTAAHTGANGELEEQFAEDIGAIPCNYEDSRSWWVLRANFSGVSTHITHHGPTGTGLPNKKDQSAARAAEYTANAYNRARLRLPKLAVYAHRHYAASGREMGVECRFLPSWKLVGAFGYRIGVTIAEPVGGYWCVCHNGQIVEEPTNDNDMGPFELWVSKRIGTWEPENSR